MFSQYNNNLSHHFQFMWHPLLVGAQPILSTNMDHRSDWCARSFLLVSESLSLSQHHTIISFHFRYPMWRFFYPCTFCFYDFLRRGHSSWKGLEKTKQWKSNLSIHMLHVDEVLMEQAVCECPTYCSCPGINSEHLLSTKESWNRN